MTISRTNLKYHGKLPGVVSVPSPHSPGSTQQLSLEEIKKRLLAIKAEGKVHGRLTPLPISSSQLFAGSSFLGGPSLSNLVNANLLVDGINSGQVKVDKNSKPGSSSFNSEVMNNFLAHQKDMQANIQRMASKFKFPGCYGCSGQGGFGGFGFGGGIGQGGFGNGGGFFVGGSVPIDLGQAKPGKPKPAPEEKMPVIIPEPGKLSGGKGKPISYTASNGYKVEIDKHTIKITDPKGKHEYKTWGDPHENLDGKHIKDWEGKTRTIKLPGGVKLTMQAKSWNGVTNHVNIFDKNRAVSIDNLKNEVESNTLVMRDKVALDRKEADGEVSFFFVNKDSEAKLVSQKDLAGYVKKLGYDKPFALLGRGGGIFKRLDMLDDSLLLALSSSTKEVQDFYDDPRLSNT